MICLLRPRLLQNPIGRSARLGCKITSAVNKSRSRRKEMKKKKKKRKAACPLCGEGGPFHFSLRSQEAVAARCLMCVCVFLSFFLSPPCCHSRHIAGRMNIFPLGTQQSADNERSASPPAPPPPPPPLMIMDFIMSLVR